MTDGKGEAVHDSSAAGRESPAGADRAREPRTMQCMEVWGGNASVDVSLALPGLQAAVFARPHGGAEGGGDVHYVSSCASGMITRLLVADVSGHGESVSGTAVTLRGLMRRYINYIDQKKFVRAMNREFTALSQLGNFATAVVGTYFAPSRRLTLCNAGHPRPLLYRAAEGVWSVMSSGDAGQGVVNLPMGIVGDAGYTQLSAMLSAGDFVLLYTDSLVEARDASGRLLGEEGLLGVVTSLGVPEMGSFVPRLLESLSANGESDDDVTVVLLRATGEAPRPGVGEQLAAVGRVVRSWIRGS